MADLTLTFARECTVTSAHDTLRTYAEAHPTILGVSTEELVSTDIVGDTRSSIVDSLMTLQVGPMLKIIAWYDNEAGYATRLVDLASRVAAG